MYEVKDKNRIIYFFNKTDADNYTDYLQNGLKITRTQRRTYYYNNGDRLINIGIGNEKRYILETRTGRKITSEKLQKKHIAAIA